jgi:hypothetical protein
MVLAKGYGHIKVQMCSLACQGAMLAWGCSCEQHFVSFTCQFTRAAVHARTTFDSKVHGGACVCACFCATVQRDAVQLCGFELVKVEGRKGRRGEGLILNHGWQLYCPSSCMPHAVLAKRNCCAVFLCAVLTSTSELLVYNIKVQISPCLPFDTRDV